MWRKKTLYFPLAKTRDQARRVYSGKLRMTDDSQCTWLLGACCAHVSQGWHIHRCRLTLRSICSIMITCDTNSDLNCAFCEGPTVMFLSFLCGKLSYGTSADKCMVFWGWFPHLKRKFHLVIIYYSVVKSFCRLLPIGANNGPNDFRRSRHAICWGCRCVSGTSEEGRGRCSDLQCFLVDNSSNVCIRVADRLFQWFGHRYYFKTYVL